MRAIWKGAITFGLVNVPIKVYSATEDHDISLHQVHDADGGRIRYQRRCEICGKVVEYEHIDKAYAEGKTTIVLTEDDLKSLPEERSKEIEVVEFVPSEQIDPIMFDRSYFLEPEKSAVKAYALLRRTLEETDRTAIVQFSLRQKTRLGALRAPGQGVDVAVAAVGRRGAGSRLRELGRRRPRLGAGVEDGVLPGGQHVGRLRARSKFSDEYQEQLRTLIAAKLEQGEALDTAATFGEEGEEAGDAEVIDLMEALRQSVERNRAGRSGSESAKKSPGQEDGRPRRPPPRRPPRRRLAAKKAPAKKSAAKKKAS